MTTKLERAIWALLATWWVLGIVAIIFAHGGMSYGLQLKALEGGAVPRSCIESSFEIIYGDRLAHVGARFQIVPSPRSVEETVDFAPTIEILPTEASTIIEVSDRLPSNGPKRQTYWRMLRHDVRVITERLARSCNRRFVRSVCSVSPQERPCPL